MASHENFASKLTALVVDDTEIIRKIHQKMLNSLGVNEKWERSIGNS